MWDWGTAVTFRVVNKAIVDFEVEEDKVLDTSFQGVLEPIPPTKLLVKPEGDRQWKWYNLWTTQPLELNAILMDADEKTYRVMRKSDWNGAGYYEYELTQGVPNE